MQKELKEFLIDLRTNARNIRTDKSDLIRARTKRLAVLLRRSLHCWEYAEDRIYVEPCTQLCADFGDFYTGLFDKVWGTSALILNSSSLELRHQVQMLAGSFSAFSWGDKDPALERLVREFAQALFDLAGAHMGVREPVKKSAPKALPTPAPKEHGSNVVSLKMFRALRP